VVQALRLGCLQAAPNSATLSVVRSPIHGAPGNMRWYRPCVLAACKQHPQASAHSNNNALGTSASQG
jgi:hypothetical protein